MLPYKSQKCRLTSKFGYRIHPITNRREFHGGVDLVGVGSDEIVAVKGGTVVRSRIVTDKSNATWQWGNYVAIQGDDGRTIYYCHLAKRLVKQGDKVKAGDCIGIQGSTGQSTGNHLHFEVRKGTNQENAADYLGISNSVGTYSSTEPVKPTAPVPNSGFAIGDKIKLTSDAKYSNGKNVPTWVKNSTLYIRSKEFDNGEYNVSTLKSGAITGRVNKAYIRKS